MISAPIPGADPQKQTEADNIQAAWSQSSYYPREDELKTAAQLAQEGYLSSVKYMRIRNKNLSEISSNNIGKLSSIVTDRVVIENIPPSSQLGAILASVQSEVLDLQDMLLNKENTGALLTAMPARVREVKLGHNVTLDPKVPPYDGQGHCTELWVGGNTRDKYGPGLRRWAEDRRWTVTVDNSAWLAMKRLGQSSPLTGTTQGIHILY